MDFSEPRSRTHNREKWNLSRVLGTFWSWRRAFLIPDCYSRWIHYFQWYTKRQSMEDHCLQSPRRKKGLYQRARSWSLGLWRNGSYGCDAENGDSQLRGLLQGTDRTRKRFERLRPHRTPKEILLQEGCTQVLRKNGAAITKFVWTVLTHPPYSPHLPPPYFNLFGALKGAILDTKFETKGYVMSAVRNWLREQDKAWYRQGMYTHVPRCCKAMRETV